jgi:hypothetical protein
MLKILISAVVLGALLSGTAHADSGDTVITVEYVVRHERIRPSPKLKHGRGTMQIVLHADGTITDQHHGYGPHAKPASERKYRLGAGKYRVIDQRTIKRVYRSGDEKRVLTVSVNGQSCAADIKFETASGKTEHRQYSTELGVQAVYGPSTLDHISCSIR